MVFRTFANTNIQSNPITILKILIDSPYLGKSVEAYPFGLGGAVTYIPRDIKQW